MYKERMGAEMLSPRERAEVNATQMDSAERSALEKSALSAPKKRSIRLALGLASALAVGMVSGESRAMNVQHEDKKDLSAETPEEKEQMQETELRIAFEQLTASDVADATKLAEYDGDSAWDAEGGGQGSKNMSGGEDFASWESKKLIISRASGNIDEADRAGQSKFDIKIFEANANANVVDTENTIRTEGVGDSEEQAVANALSEAAGVMKSKAHESSLQTFAQKDDKGNNTGKFVTISTLKSESVIDGFKITLVNKPAHEGAQFSVTIEAREAQIKS